MEVKSYAYKTDKKDYSKKIIQHETDMLEIRWHPRALGLENRQKLCCVFRWHGKETFLPLFPGGSQARCSCPYRLLEPGTRRSTLPAASPQLASAEHRPLNGNMCLCD